MHQAQAHQAVDGFEHVNAVPPCDGDAGRAADSSAAFQYPSDHLGWQLGNGHADDGQRHDGRAAHGVDVGQRVGSGDAAEVVRVVHDGREEVGGGHQRLLVVQAVDGGVVAGLGAHQQLGRHQALRRACQNLAQQAGCNLAATPSAVRELGKLDVFSNHGRGIVHGGVIVPAMPLFHLFSTGVFP